MRGVLIGVAVLGCWLGSLGPARAGLYNTGEHLPPNIPYDSLRLWVGLLREVRDPIPPPRVPQPPKKGSLRESYLRQTDALEEARKAGNLSAVGRANLGACYIRRGHPDKAEALLRAGDKGHFLVEANLAMAYHLLGQPERAISHQETALRAWPGVWVGWSRQQLYHYWQAERYFLRLLKARQREPLRPPGRVVTVDPLFPAGNLDAPVPPRAAVRYVGPDRGAYEAGNLAPEMANRLPPDAFNVLFQLVLWLPDDQRLYWQLGELLNAMGQVKVASEILKELAESGNITSFEDLAGHRRVLLRAVENLPALIKPETRCSLLALSALVSGWSVPVPLAGAVGQELAAVTPVALAPLLSQPPPQPAPPALAQPTPAPDSGLPDWRNVTIGFAAGFVVAALLGLQWQELLRRLRQRGWGPTR